MDKEFVTNLIRGNHYLKTGIFGVGFILSFGVFLNFLGEYRYAFLFGLLFLPLLIIEFIHYYLITREFRRNITKKAILKVGRISIIEMKKNNVGILFEGIIDKKVYELKYYFLGDMHERVLQNLARYKMVEIEFYPKSNIVLDFHSVKGE